MFFFFFFFFFLVIRPAKELCVFAEMMVDDLPSVVSQLLKLRTSVKGQH